MSQTKLKVIENNNMDKENRNKALDDAVGLIEKNYGKGSIMKLGSNSKIDIDSYADGTSITVAATDKLLLSDSLLSLSKDSKNILFLGKYFISLIFTLASAQQAEINCKP